MNILVVDDEVAFAQLLGRSLRRLGHDATVAGHPEDALEIFRANTFDAVITDIDMPSMSGLDLARTLRAERADVPIAFCTGSAEGTSTTLASLIGAVLPKVWREDDVRMLVDTLRIPPR
jgi:CheY-like chemotaxis protein